MSMLAVGRCPLHAHLREGAALHLVGWGVPAVPEEHAEGAQEKGCCQQHRQSKCYRKTLPSQAQQLQQHLLRAVMGSLSRHSLSFSDRILYSDTYAAASQCNF